MPAPRSASSTATIADLLAAGGDPLFSFEFFPPKDETAEQQLWQTLRELQRLRPDFVSVTYGANGSNRDRTIRVTRDIERETGLRTMAHLTCVAQPVSQLRHVLGSYAEAGIRHILAVRGDMPGGPTVPWEAHPQGLQNATELVRLVKSLGNFCVGVGAFPDAHPEHYDFDLDARILVDKAEAGADFAITQLFFDPDAYFRLVERVRNRGCDLPIIPGVQPVTNIKQIERFAALSGAELPTRVTDRLHAVADNPEDVRKVGVEIATELSQALLAGGAPGLHYYTLNRSRATREIAATVRPNPGRG